MISSSRRINSKEFKKFFNKGIKKNSKNFRVSIIKEKNNIESKYAVIISKKIAKTAVLRHKNKRIIYKIISQIYPQFLINKYTFIFIKKDISSFGKQELTKELTNILA